VRVAVVETDGASVLATSRQLYSVEAEVNTLGDTEMSSLFV